MKEKRDCFTLATVFTWNSCIADLDSGIRLVDYSNFICHTMLDR